MYLPYRSFQVFQNSQTQFYQTLLAIFLIPADHIVARLFDNMVLSTVMIQKAIPGQKQLL